MTLYCEIIVKYEAEFFPGEKFEAKIGPRADTDFLLATIGGGLFLILDFRLKIPCFRLGFRMMLTL